MKIAIVSDSNSGITPKQAEELGFYLLPTPIIIEGEQYFQDVNLTEEEFYEKLTSGTLISTSQPNQYDAEQLWSGLLEKYDQVIYFPISSGLSTTCFNMQKLAEEKFQGKVFVIDNKRVSIPMRQSMLDAQKMADEGKTGEEIQKWLTDTGLTSSIYIMVNTLEYLRRGGRLSPAAAVVGTALHLKPILQINGGLIESYKNVRKLSDGKDAMIKAVKNDLATRFKDECEAGKMCISIAHTQNLEEAKQFSERLKAEIPEATYEGIQPLNLSVAVHTGPGSLAIACYVKY